MNHLFDIFIHRTAEDIHNLYINDDEGKYEFNELIDMFEDAVCNYIEKEEPDYECKIIEYDEDFDEPLQVMNDIVEDLQGYKIKEYYTAEISCVHFWIVLVNKGE